MKLAVRLPIDPPPRFKFVKGGKYSIKLRLRPIARRRK